MATIAHRRRVQNHIGTVHAIALCNLAEFVGGLATDEPVLKQSRKPVPPLPEKSNLEKQFPSVILERVDPHGNKLIKPTEELITSTKECQICHTLENKKVSTHSQLKEICSSCHNKAPYSGIEEHFKHQVSCLD